MKIVDHFVATQGKSADVFDPLDEVRDCTSLRAELVGAVEAELLRRGSLHPNSTALVHVAQTFHPASVWQPPPGAHFAEKYALTVGVSNACASGLAALTMARSILDASLARDVLIVGVATSTEGDLHAFGGVGALTTGLARPFDVGADGTSLASLAVAVLVSSDESEVPYGHPAVSVLGIAGRVNGGGAASRVEDQVEVMLAAGRSQPPSLVIAHATGTRHGDRVEADAIARAASEWGRALTVVSFKGRHGHAAHAAGLMSMVDAIEVFARGTVMGTTNLHQPLQHPDRLFFPLEGAEVQFDRRQLIMINAFGFGGNTFSALLGSDHGGEVET